MYYGRGSITLVGLINLVSYVTAQIFFFVLQQVPKDNDGTRWLAGTEEEANTL
jgi:uncharacterized membrane protein